MRQRLAILAVLMAVVVWGCIDDVYVGGRPCASSFECALPPEDSVEDSEPQVSPVPEQCVSTGAAFVCAPLPFTRPETTCTNTAQCYAAGFPVEAECTGVCQCPGPFGTLPPGCIWNPNSCTCGGTPPEGG
jgi:hypothetical protein